MNYDYYEKYINKKTTGRYDVTPLFENPEVFNRLIGDLIKPFKNIKFDKIVGLDALGFVLAGAIAIGMKKGFVPVRKEGKLPGVEGTVVRTSFVDYSKNGKTFEINRNSTKKGDKVLIVDEWIEIGTQLKASIKLIEKLGGKVIGISALNVDENNETRILFDKYNLKPIHDGE
jgi:adenine phosphoribosyltransferase